MTPDGNVIISMQIVGVLVGGLGIILATPLTAAAMVRMIYLEDIGRPSSDQPKNSSPSIFEGAKEAGSF